MKCNELPEWQAKSNENWIERVDALGEEDDLGAWKSVAASGWPIWCGNTPPPAATSICRWLHERHGGKIFQMKLDIDLIHFLPYQDLGTVLLHSGISYCSFLPSPKRHHFNVGVILCPCRAIKRTTLLMAMGHIYRKQSLMSCWPQAVFSAYFICSFRL